MKRFKGTVKNNVIVLDEGTRLPEGTRVEVRLRKDAARKAKLRAERLAAIQRILNSPITHPVGIEEIIEEDKKEREEYWPFEGNAEQ